MHTTDVCSRKERIDSLFQKPEETYKALPPKMQKELEIKKIAFLSAKILGQSAFCQQLMKNIKDKSFKQFAHTVTDCIEDVDKDSFGKLRKIVLAETLLQCPSLTNDPVIQQYENRETSPAKLKELTPLLANVYCLMSQFSTDVQKLLSS